VASTRWVLGSGVEIIPKEPSQGHLITLASQRLGAQHGRCDVACGDHPYLKITRQTPGEPTAEREIGEHADLFVEYVGDYPDRSASQFMLNSGGEWRFTRTQQLDFHVAIGLNNSAPHYIFGLGYSFRFDGLFGP
jgi:hypothetical protein